MVTMMMAAAAECPQPWWESGTSVFWIIVAIFIGTAIVIDVAK